MKTKNLFALSIILFMLTSSLIAQVPTYVPTSGLKAWLGFNGNANDLSGNANNATNTGATFVADRNGNPSAAASFNGTSNYMQITTPSFSFSPTGSFTYSFWMNKQTQANASGIVMMSGTSTTGVFITLIQGANSFSFGTNKQQSAWFNTSCAHTLNVWDHYVTTYNSGVMKIYKNGVFQSTTTYTHVGATTSNIPFIIARGIGGNSTCFKGTLDDFGIWDRELSQIEINDLFTSITAVPEFNSDLEVMIYPNPVSDILIMKVNPTQIGLTYTILDAQGKRIETGKIININTSIDIKALPVGTYFLICGIQNGNSHKFIKNKE